MWFGLRVLVLLAVTLPLFVATHFRPLWWQIGIAALFGAALGRLAVRFGQRRRVLAWGAGVGATLVLALTIGWAFAPTWPAHAASPSGFLVVRSSEQASLTWDDVAAIEQTHIAAPVLHRTAPLFATDANWSTRLIGTTPSYFDIRGLRVTAGDRLTTSTLGAGNKVVVLGATVVSRLFDTGGPPIGETIRINQTPFTIVGVLAAQGQTPEGLDQDDVAIVPLEVYRARLDGTRPGFTGALYVAAPDPAAVAAELRTLLRGRHRLASDDEDDFRILDSNATRR